MNNNNIPVSQKYSLTIEEASQYFNIGLNKLRRLAAQNPSAKWVLMKGNRILIKRSQFEKLLDDSDAI